MRTASLPHGMCKRGDVYYACFRAGGRQIRKKLSRDFGTAKIIFADLWLSHRGISEDEWKKLEAGWESRKKSPSKFVYFIEDQARNAVKIGRARDCDQRLSELQCGNSSPLKLIAFYECNDAVNFEYSLHEKFHRHRITREWFSMCEEIRNYINETCDFT